jgi:hypothetical protein
LHLTPAREPRRNDYVESFNSRIRDEYLNINSFWLLAQARAVISDWKHCRPLASLSVTGWERKLVGWACRNLQHRDESGR